MPATGARYLRAHAMNCAAAAAARGCSSPAGSTIAVIEKSSNSGVFARRPEARYHQNERHLARVIELQRRILDERQPRRNS